MLDKSLSVADIEAILLDIHRREESIAIAAEKRNQSVDFFKSLIHNAQQNFLDETAEDKSQIEILKHQLETYFTENPPKGRKSLKFAGGSFGYSKSQTKFFLNGEQVDADSQPLLSFVKAKHGEFLKIKEYVDWATFKTKLNADDPDNVFLQDSGEIIDGLRAKKTFFVKTN